MNKNQPHVNAYRLNNHREDNLADDELVLYDIQHTDLTFRDQESEINLESILSAPMVAISKANSTMLSGQSEFILHYCFNRIEATDKSVAYEPKMIALSIKRHGEDISFIEIPLLTLLPINSLAIDKMKVKFNMEITSISSYKATTTVCLERKAQLSGKLTGNKKNTNSLAPNKNLDVFVEAAALPLPNGLLNIIDMYSKIN